MRFTESNHCSSRKNCTNCRISQVFRDTIRRLYEVPDDYDARCPFGVYIDVSSQQPVDPSPPPVAPSEVPESPICSAAELAARAAICSSCRFYVAAREFCRKCGCSGRNKSKLKSVTCPIQRW